MEEARFERWEERRPLPGLAAECFELHENRPGIFASSHWHNESELILVQRGCYRILAGAEGRLLAAGEAVFIPQRLRHTTICPDQPEVSLIVLKFEPSFLLAADPAFRRGDGRGRPLALPDGDGLLRAPLPPGADAQGNRGGAHRLAAGRPSGNLHDPFGASAPGGSAAADARPGALRGGRGPRAGF